MHRAALADPSKHRFAIWRCFEVEAAAININLDDDCGGLGDRFPGIVGIFLFALLTNRAFLMDWYVQMAVSRGDDDVSLTQPHT